LNLAVAKSLQVPRYEDENKQLIQLRDLAASRLTKETLVAAQRSASQWRPQRSTANVIPEWREKPAIARAPNETASASPYSGCELH
jgi:hypothetical protein